MDLFIDPFIYLLTKHLLITDDVPGTTRLCKHSSGAVPLPALWELIVWWKKRTVMRKALTESGGTVPRNT